MLALIIFLIVLFIVSIVLYNGWTSWVGGDGWFATSLLSGLLLLFMILFLIAYRTNDYSELQQYNVTKATVENLKKSEGKIGSSSYLIEHIVKINGNLAKAKYWNQGFFDIYVLDKYAECSFILLDK